MNFSLWLFYQTDLSQHRYVSATMRYQKAMDIFAQINDFAASLPVSFLFAHQFLAQEFTCHIKSFLTTFVVIFSCNISDNDGS